MTLEIKHAEQLSRGELLLRTFFGAIYIMLPHLFLLAFVGLWGAILSFIAFWAILFTGRYPQSFFEFRVGLIRWQTRLNARLYNLADGYPAFGVNGTDDATKVEIPYPETISRSMTLVRLFFGIIYVIIPHGFVLFFLAIGVWFCYAIGWWAVLFTGRFPLSFHNFITGQMRWSTRVRVYMANMTDTYPPFTLD